jgi:sugar phosphate isomerase/epimerase
MFELAVFADDIHQDLDYALSVVKEFDLEWVELRGAWGKNLLFQSDEELDRTITTLHNHGLKVPSVSAPIFKSHLPGYGDAETGEMFNSEARDAPEQQMELIRRSAHVARLLSTDLVRCFSFWRLHQHPSEFWDEMAPMYQMAVEVAAEEGITLVMENDFETNLGSGELACQMIAQINSPHLRLLWDCGNAFFVGEEPYPTGYEISKPWIGHVHVKDAVIDASTGKPRWVELGTGDIDMLGQLKALKEDGYTGVVSMENHYKPEGGTAEDGVRASYAGLQRLMAQL